MPTVTKTFNFTSDSEGWVATPGDVRVEMNWKSPEKARGWHTPIHQSSDPLMTMGGTLHIVAKHSTSSAENYWEWSGTWEDLGVPSGKIVTNLDGSHLYRWDQNKNRNVAQFLGTETGSGPFELRDSGGTLIDTITTREYAIDRVASLWQGYPAGAALDPVVSQTAWAESSGAIAIANDPSNTSIKLRLRSLTPETDVWTHPNGARWVKLKQDFVNLIITYGDPPSEQNFFFAS